jgi:hypothetical protein
VIATAGGDRLANRQQAGVEVGAVAEVGEDVLLVGERRLADPGHAFAAHVGEGRGIAVHPGHHVVAADAGDGARAFGHARRGVVRAAGAEVGVRWMACRAGSGGQREAFLLGFEQRQAGLDGRRGEEAPDARGERPGDLVATDNSPAAGSSQSPCVRCPLPVGSSDHSPFSSNLPTTRGRTSSRQL